MVPGPESIEEISSCEAGLRAERATPRAVAGAHRRRKGTPFGFRIGRVAGFPSNVFSNVDENVRAVQWIIWRLLLDLAARVLEDSFVEAHGFELK